MKLHPEKYTPVIFLQGLIKFNESKKLFERIDADPKNPDVFKQQAIMSLYEDKTGKIWISAQNGFFNYDPHTGSFNEIKLFTKSAKPDFWTNSVGTVYQDDDGFLWIPTGTNGIFRYNMKTNEILPLDQSEFPNSVHNSDGFWYLYKDHFGILWIATRNNGLLKLDFQKEPFRLYTNPADKVNPNKNLLIFSIYKDPAQKDFVWLGTDDGLTKYNLKEKTFGMIKHLQGSSKSIPGDLVRSIQNGSVQDLWLGTDKGLSLMDTKNNSFRNFDLSDFSKHCSVDYNDIYNMTLDDYGNLWTASGASGIARFDTKNDTKQFIPTLDLHVLIIPDLSIL